MNINNYIIILIHQSITMSYTLKNKLLHDYSNNIYKYINSYIDYYKKEKYIKRQIINKDIIDLYRFCGQDGSIVPHWRRRVYDGPAY